MRTLDATLQTALATFHFVPYFKLKVYRNGAYLTTLDVLKYSLTGTHLSVTTRGLVSLSTSPDWIKIVLERGIVSNGTPYVLDSSKFTPVTGSAERLSSKSLYVSTTIEAELIPPKPVSFDGSYSYQTVITSFCTAIGKTPVFKNPGAAFWAAQFMPNGTTVTLNDARMFISLLQQKRLIFACDNGGEAILFYCALDIPGGYDASIDPVLYSLNTGYFARRRFMATDENSIVTYAGTVGDKLFNLGYKYDADPFPAVFSQAQPIEFTLPINLQYQDGDHFAVDGGGYSVYPAQVTEIFDTKASPGWQVHVKQLQYFSNTEGGSLPSDLAIRSPYMPVNTSMFDHILDTTCNNLQTCFDRLDDHLHSVVYGSHGLRATIPAGLTYGLAHFMSGLQYPPLNSTFPKSGIVKNLYMAFVGTQPVSGSLVATLLISGAATGLVLTVPAGSGNINLSDLIHSASYIAGQTITVWIVNNSAGPSIGVGFMAFDFLQTS